MKVRRAYKKSRDCKFPASAHTLRLRTQKTGYKAFISTKALKLNNCIIFLSSHRRFSPYVDDQTAKGTFIYLHRAKLENGLLISKERKNEK